MTERGLRDLFEAALDDEPEHIGLVDDDIARGRARRARRMRRLAGSGAVSVVTAVAAVTIPASPLSIVDGDEDPNQVATTTGIVAPEVANDPLRRDLWHSIQESLPDDARLADGSSVHGLTHGAPGIRFVLEKQHQGHDRQIGVNIALQNARPELDNFHPCNDTNSELESSPFDGTCEAGRDAEGRWRVFGTHDDLSTGAVVLEGGHVATTVTWSDMAAEAEEDGQVTAETAELLSPQEADAIASAAWHVGTERDEAELVSGIDLTATLDAWQQLAGTLEDELELGPLTPVRPDDDAEIGGAYDDTTGAISDIDRQHQSGVIAARYRTDEGTEVDVVIWQKDRTYDTFCHPRLPLCDSIDAAHLEDEDRSDLLSGISSLGNRAGLYVALDSGEPVDPDEPEGAELNERVVSAQTRLTQAVSLLGDDRHSDL
ncbi:hypothetical protein EF847_07555 [Actinobacteria bacterium YIM 96077]|uniref:Uncharacterized protein n=1 Tax=Phytoactinopolyspora halophila TaxID=1981511 RepID=A0A329QJL1_9ACTN|nr:hypothetical protein [Phytoactinopolyspora halophila]AYY12583.1 hypothetical protein EF847_07555 [Actinobacteria bacterium YIM 96077]RAW12514.1 hypothetical protein DPM12_14035 [Phytoactinopolyspora halophila]